MELNIHQTRELPEIPVAVSELDKYLELVERYRDVLGLTASLDEFRDRHVCESLLLGELLQETSAGEPVIDLGSGNGIPGVPIAISTGMEVELWERSERRYHFLELVRSQLELERVSVRRVDVNQAEALSEHATLIAKALMPLDDLVPLAGDLLANGGELWVFVSRQPEQLDPSIIGLAGCKPDAFPYRGGSGVSGTVLRYRFDA